LTTLNTVNSPSMGADSLEPIF